MSPNIVHHDLHFVCDYVHVPITVQRPIQGLILAAIAMPDILEELALSGVLFETSTGPGSRPHSPVSRTPSPNTDDELFGDLSREASPEQPEPGTSESIGMGPGRTGVKGVIRDRDEARERDRARQASEMREMRHKMEKAAITGKTFFEEEEERRKQKAKEEDEDKSDSDSGRWRHQRRKGVTIQFPGTGNSSGDARTAAYGYLREVGASGFVQAVEQVARTVWVVVHLYHPVRPFSFQLCWRCDPALIMSMKRAWTGVRSWMPS